jgi:isoleucyl-tRNA synthetase
VVIWTTTPWTLPANLAIALHPDFEYAAVETTVTGEVLILARELVENCMATFGIGDLRILGDFGRRTAGKQALPPPLLRSRFADHSGRPCHPGSRHRLRAHRPGHGREDYEVGLQYGLDAYSPVNDNGCFTDEVEQFAGQFVFKANAAINQTLADRGPAGR